MVAARPAHTPYPRTVNWAAATVSTFTRTAGSRGHPRLAGAQ